MANDSAHPVQTIRHDFSTASVTTAWTTLSSSLTGNASVVELYNSSTSFLELGVGGGSAPTAIYPFSVFPSGGNGRIGLLFDKSTKLFVRATAATASSGVFAINFFN